MNFGLNFGLKTSTAEYCDRPAGELINNWTFDCGKTGWKTVNTSPTFDSGNVDILRQSSGSRVEQEIYLDVGTYTIETEVVSTGGSGFVFMNPAGSGGNYPLDFLPVGVHTTDVDVTTAGPHTFGPGANNPIGSHTVFSYLSIKKKT